MIDTSLTSLGVSDERYEVVLLLLLYIVDERAGQLDYLALQ